MMPKHIFGICAIAYVFSIALAGCVQTERTRESRQPGGDAAALATLATCNADLTVTFLQAPTGAARGASITVTDITANVSATCTATPSSTTWFYLSTTSNGPVSKVLKNNRAVPELPPLSNFWWSGQMTVPANTTAGMYFLVDSADHGTVVTETDEGNNRRSSAFKVW
jgi:hypothetical protein